MLYECYVILAGYLNYIFSFFQLIKYSILRNINFELGKLKLAFLCLVLVLFFLLGIYL